MNLSTIFQLMRVQHYVKNLFIFLPLFFALQITDTDKLVITLIAFIAFSLSASAIYILNDYFDIEEDQKHPVKKNRPLASEAISKRQAIIIMLTLMTIAYALLIPFSIQASIIITTYIVLNIAYSLKLKHVAIIDISIVASGFVLRLFVGAKVADIQLSSWIVIMTFLLALFMALAKRRDDVLIFQKTGEKMRKVIDGYNLQFLDAAIIIMASIVIVAYTIYTTSLEIVSRANSEYLYLTALFVIIGILRYLQITYIEENSGSPAQIALKDHFIQATLLGWIIVFAWIIY